MASSKRRTTVEVDLDDQLTESRKKRKVVRLLKEYCNGLKHLEIEEVSELCAESDCITWLVSKFGFFSVRRAVDIYRCLPESLTASQKMRFLNMEEPVVGEIVEFAENFCPTLLVSSEKCVGDNEQLVLAPPVKECVECGNQLISNHSCSVKVYMLHRATMAEKATLRCKKCALYYNFSSYGNKSGEGFRYYEYARKFVEVSDTTYFERNLLEFQCSLANHAWTSFQGFAESYNDAFELPKEMEMSPETCANAFYVGELEMELRRIGKEDYRFKLDADREECMKMIEEYRRENLYPHAENVCSPDCKARGCGRLWVTDGVWKLSFPHCMYKVDVMVEGIPTLHLPDVCTESPLPGKAFCDEHCQLLQTSAPDVPTGLRDFLKYSGVLRNEDEGVTDAMLSKVESTVIKLPPSNIVKDKSAAHAQGISSLISSYPGFVQDSVVETGELLCRKDTGSNVKLRKWSRGHQFVVRGGGHIDTWQPLYKSESPSQVFLILIQWLSSLARTNNLSIPPILAYDNMCNLQRIKAAQKPLPFLPTNDQLWANVSKIIDVFHFKNHVSPVCQEMFSPAAIKEENPFFNTQAGEQTFTWLTRFKNSLCSMSKDHHLFYLHRMVVRRNAYTSKCYKYGRKPVLPKSKS